MNNACWIFYPGDYELYHSLLLHRRRQEFSVDLPPSWQLCTPYPSVTFRKEFRADKPFSFHAAAKGDACGCVVVGGKRYPLNEEIRLGAGNYLLEAQVVVDGGLPCLYVRSDGLVTDESWSVRYPGGDFVPVGAEPRYVEESDDPRVFPFVYKRLRPTAVETLPGGTLYDFGGETFARLFLSGCDEASPVAVYYGESREEATDPSACECYLTLSGKKRYTVPARAFRFLMILHPAPLSLRAEEEEQVLPEAGAFSCDESLVNDVYALCKRTFRLCSREFFLDGIKRDRWVWSGDAYQSYLAARYLYGDPAVTKRTIVALLGKPPYEQHINTINDYTMFLLLGAAEYWFSSGDDAFLSLYYPRFSALYGFLAGRADERGYICERPGDWIFIDWADMDKSAPLAAEQILFWKTKRAMAEMTRATGGDPAPFLAEADALKASILRDFYDEKRGVFVDCLGSTHVTRHPHILAILYDFVGEDEQRKFVKNVLDNGDVAEITTPYFTFFELCARAKLGNVAGVLDKIRSYWGGMLSLGATSVWERFDPTEEGTEHLAMYGRRFGCSLCHAWGAGPIYLLGRYVLGVSSTAFGTKSFTVSPATESFRAASGTVPLPGGEHVSVSWKNGTLRVTASAPGGILRFGGKDTPITPGKELVVKF